MRLAKAFCIVLALVLLVPLVDVLIPQDEEQTVSASATGISAKDVAGGHSVDEFLANLESLANQTESAPSWFEDEIGLLPSARDVRSSGSVVGYVVDEESSKVMEQLRLSLSERGWQAVSLGEIEGATFMKSSGMCTWALVTCTQIDDATSVVVRCNAS